jgi:hypothetical protein
MKKMKELISIFLCLFIYVSGSVYGQDSAVTANHLLLNNQKTNENLTTSSSAIMRGSFPRFRIALGGGFGYRLAIISPDIKDEFLRNYLRKLKSGYQFYAEATGYFNSFVGLGIKANVFRASHTEYNVIASDETGNIVYIGEMSDNTTTLFIAPTFFARFIHGRKENALSMSGGIGYIRYWDKAVFITPFSLIGNTIGVSYDIGYDFRLNDLLLLGINGGFTYGILSTVKQIDATQTTTQTVDPPESLFRMDLSVGIRFSKKPDRFR